MDDFTSKHLDAWISRSVHDEEQETVNAMIRAFVAEYPDLCERTDIGWPEIRQLAENSL